MTPGSVRQFPLAFISRQFGRASAPTIPHRVQTIRGRKARTKTASAQPPADSTASWRHSSHVTASERTPIARYRVLRRDPVAPSPSGLSEEVAWILSRSRTISRQVMSSA